MKQYLVFCDDSSGYVLLLECIIIIFLILKIKAYRLFILWRSAYNIFVLLQIISKYNIGSGTISSSLSLAVAKLVSLEGRKLVNIFQRKNIFQKGFEKSLIFRRLQT